MTKVWYGHSSHRVRAMICTNRWYPSKGVENQRFVTAITMGPFWQLRPEEISSLFWSPAIINWPQVFAYTWFFYMLLCLMLSVTISVNQNIQSQQPPQAWHQFRFGQNWRPGVALSPAQYRVPAYQHRCDPCPCTCCCVCRSFFVGGGQSQGGLGIQVHRGGGTNLTHRRQGVAPLHVQYPVQASQTKRDLCYPG